ncbi:MAG: lysozyme [Erysipelotrichaceae bacterium]|jgi:GH25 family lysozyme M1 (1,4-beta-N-acetylmuramidase)|nr:lysozyme [Erysipelotrichaceae bacterium]
MTKRKRRKLQKNIIIGTAVIAAMIVCSASFVSCTRSRLLKEQSQLIAFEYPYPTNNYQWDHLQIKGDYVSYEDENYTSQQGVDVSVHQGTIDWKKVAGAGIEFAFIRTAYRGYGTGDFYSDDQFEANMKGANENGIDAGIYVFSQAITVAEAAEEADYAIQSAKNYKIDLPIVFDMEGSIDGEEGRVMTISSEERSQMAVTFMNRVKAAGYDVMYYGSTSLLENMFDLQYVQEYPLWLAEYDVYYPNYPYQFAYWQYSSTAQVPGIDGNTTDMDIRFVPKN